MTVISSPPTRVPEVDQNGFTTREWRSRDLEIQSGVQASPQIISNQTVAGQTAAIPATALPLPLVTAGTFRISPFATITVAAGVSSSLSITIQWTFNGLPQSRTQGPLTTNTAGDSVGSSFTIIIDNNSPITYATTYASNPVNQMKYTINVVAEAL